MVGTMLVTNNSLRDIFRREAHMIVLTRKPYLLNNGLTQLKLLAAIKALLASLQLFDETKIRTDTHVSPQAALT